MLLNPCNEFLEDEFVRVDLISTRSAWLCYCLEHHDSLVYINGRCLGALELFKTMMNMDIKPTISFMSVFPAIVGYEDRKSSVVFYLLFLK